MTRTPVPTEFQNQPNRPTEKQESFINRLLEERALEDGDRELIESCRARGGDSWTKKVASGAIEMLLKRPKLNIPRQGSGYNVASNRNCPLPDVPAGRYAVEHDGVLKFYRVDKPTEGRWAGWTFLNVQASDEWYPVKAFDYKREVLESIAVDPQAASARYGHELGQCGICGRTLTDEESRARGIGPVCAAANGWL